ncbi:TetR family transcriptional regulator [Curtobacterium luteum]|uniref:TetR family transcriptional regulator n=1 Tax=Curtobacterium luteum TaxID=33881 RepID=UPI000736AB2F|nr:TetR family transcriptional regulator [Curtobacterium luteum]
MTEDEGTRGYRSRADRREELLDAAALVVRDDGLSGLTTRAVAARAGVAHGVVHYVFGARQHLVVALLERQARALLPRVLTAAEEHDDLDDALDAAVAAWVDLVRREPERFRLLEAASSSTLDPTGDGAAMEAERALWQAAVASGIEHWAVPRGVTLTVPVVDAADAVIAVVDGLVRSSASDPDGTVTERARVLLVRGLAHALTTPR